ncbi:MAG: hypothetical protein IJN49_06650 [Clostridia bacterium]|nr:hypothetical protein [Clostridia bacterium]
MSKHKKRNKKQRKERLPAKEHYKFDLLLLLIIIYNNIILVGMWKNWFTIFKPDALYFLVENSFFEFLVIFFNLQILFIYGNLHTFATDNKYPFKDYFRGTNKLAKEKSKKSFTKCTIIFFISIICLFLGIQKNIESTETNFIKNNVFSEQVLFEYKNVEKIEIKFSHEKVSPKGFDYSIRPKIKITDNKNIYELEFKGFGFSYLKLEKFLNKFNSDIIYIDNKNIKNVIIADENEKTAFKRIFYGS